MNNTVDHPVTHRSGKYILRAFAYFVALSVVVILARRVFGDGLSAVAPTWLSALAGNVAYLLGVLALTWFFCRIFDRARLRDLGLQKQAWFGKLVVGGGLGVFLQLLVFLSFVVASWITIERAPWQPVQFVASIISWTIISFNEELAFRGYIMQRLSQGWGMPAAIFVSSLLFAGVHVLNPNFEPLAFLSLFVAGCLLATAYLVSRSLWLPIGLHIGWNLAEIHFFGFAGSGLTEPALLRSVVHGPQLMTGGAFGPEGGLVGLAAPLLGILILVLVFRIALARKRRI
jgi:membrane protease YdiL (CAAX protease family)